MKKKFCLWLTGWLSLLHYTETIFISRIAYLTMFSFKCPYIFIKYLSFHFKFYRILHFLSNLICNLIINLYALKGQFFPSYIWNTKILQIKNISNYNMKYSNFCKFRMVILYISHCIPLLLVHKCFNNKCWLL